MNKENLAKNISILLHKKNPSPNRHPASLNSFKNVNIKSFYRPDIKNDSSLSPIPTKRNKTNTSRVESTMLYS